MAVDLSGADDSLDVLACLRQIEQACPSPKATGTAKGIRQACEFEASHGSLGGSAFLRNYNKLAARLESWTGPLAERVKGRLQVHHARLSGR